MPGCVRSEQLVQFLSTLNATFVLDVGSGLATLAGGGAVLPLECIPWDRVGGTDHGVLHHGAAHHRLVIVVVERVFVGEPLEHRRVASADIVEAHRVSARAIVAGNAHERIEIVQTARRIIRRRIGVTAVGLLPHVEQPVHHVTGIAVVGQAGPGDLESAVRQVAGVTDAGILGEHRQAEAPVRRGRDPQIQTTARLSATASLARSS